MKATADAFTTACHHVLRTDSVLPPPSVTATTRLLQLASPALPVTKDNLLEAWQTVYHAPPTAKIAKSMN